MLTIKLQSATNFSQDPAWEELVAAELQAPVHPGRRQGFCLARSALQQGLKDLGRSISIAQLRLEHFDALMSVPEYTLSLSHTSEWGAAVLAPRNQFISVGIDIEPLERRVNPLVLERITHPQDTQLSPITHWALKEAVFKTLMNTRRFEKNIEFSSIELQDKHWSHSSGLKGAWQLQSTQDLVIATAWMEA